MHVHVYIIYISQCTLYKHMKYLHYMRVAGHYPKISEMIIFNREHLSTNHLAPSHKFKHLVNMRCCGMRMIKKNTSIHLHSDT